ncbi:MAG: hypothetical protein QXW70_03335 [Candidatus Anstonellales archaeon]
MDSKTPPKKRQFHPIENLKNQNKILHRFGEVGLRVFAAIDGVKSRDRIIDEARCTEKEYEEIISFMEAYDMLDKGGSNGEEHESKEDSKSIDEEGAERVNIKPEITVSQTITPSASRKEMTKEEERLAQLSPLEKKIYKKYGEIGVNIYHLIDGEKTAEQILHEVGISEVKLVEILEFLENEGIIKIEKQSPPLVADQKIVDQKIEKDVAEGVFYEGWEEKRGRKELFAPIVEEKDYFDEGSAVPKDETAASVIPIDIPLKKKIGLVKETRIKAGIILKFGSAGSRVYELINGVNDAIDIALETKLSLETLDKIFEWLGQEKAVLFKRMKREEIRKKYGEEGLMIYKKYGREGILLYELIGREKKLKDVIITSKLPPARAVDILLFIHSALNLDLPIDKKTLYNELGL